MVVPAVRPFASPFVGTTLLTEATAAADDVHDALDVTSIIVPSRNVPIALNEVAVVAAIVTVVGLTDSAVSGLGTVTTVVPVIAPDLAEIVVVPGATAVTSPLALTVAVAVAEELQVAVEVRLFDDPSE